MLAQDTPESWRVIDALGQLHNCFHGGHWNSRNNFLALFDKDLLYKNDIVILLSPLEYLYFNRHQ